jgi:hypothetical protein
LTLLKTIIPRNLWTDQLINKSYKANRSIDTKEAQKAKSFAIRHARSSEVISKRKGLTTPKPLL